MSVFAGYAPYYDLFYRDKDYAAEAAFVARRLRKNTRAPRRLIELGCGTGRHALQLVRDGFEVAGIDRSAEMVRGARLAARRLPARLRRRFTAEVGDASALARTGAGFDAAVSLFHVASYQTSNAALSGLFASARATLGPGGLFLFDFWHGAGVLTDPPAVRVKRAATARERVTRLAEPVLHAGRNCVDVNYTFLIETARGGKLREFRETHTMRYLFLPEVEAFGRAAGFAVCESGEWMTGRPLDEKAWCGYAVLRAQ